MTGPSSSPFRRRLLLIAAVLTVGLPILSVWPELLWAQGQGAPTSPGGGRQMRDFWHVFVAYGLAWLLVFGWAVSIARRLRRVEERLES